MVKFKLMDITSERLVYHYYPESNLEKKPGVIIADRKTGEVWVEELAEDDWEREISAEEANDLVDDINRMIAESDGIDFEDYVSEAGHLIYFGVHAADRIRKDLAEGNIPKEGVSAWY